MGLPSTSGFRKFFKNMRRSAPNFVPEPDVPFRLAGETETRAKNNHG